MTIYSRSAVQILMCRFTKINCYVKALLKFTLPPWVHWWIGKYRFWKFDYKFWCIWALRNVAYLGNMLRVLRFVPHVTCTSTSQFTVGVGVISFLLCGCILYKLKSKQSLTSMTEGAKSCNRKHCVCINIRPTASDLITALSRADAKILSLLPLEMLPDCWWVLVGIWSKYSTVWWGNHKISCYLCQMVCSK